MVKIEFPETYNYESVVKNKAIVLNVTSFDENSDNISFDFMNDYTSPISQFRNNIVNSINNDFHPNKTLSYKDYEKLTGGAPSKKKGSKEKGNENMENMKSSKQVPNNLLGPRESISISIKDLGNKVISEVFKNYPYVIESSRFEGSRALSTVKEILAGMGENLTISQFEMLMNYITLNFFDKVKNQIVRTHPMFNIVSNDQRLSIKSILSLSNYIDPNTADIPNNNRVAISKDISINWKDITDLESYTNRVEFDENLIDPLFWLLFATKLPGFEDLCILQDYMKLLESLTRNELDSDNNMLMILRSADPSLLPVRDPKYNSPIANETLRLNIAVYLRELSILVRKGNFKSKLSSHLLNLLKEIHMPNKKFPEENMISAILSVFSFKPTLISKTKGVILRSNNSVIDSNSLHGPRLDEKIFAVHTIEYPLLDFYSVLRNEIPTFSTSNFQAIVYNTTSNKATFIRRDPDESADKEKLVNNLLNIVLNKTSEINTADFASTLINRNGIDAMSKTQFPTTVLLTNGMYIVSVPREDTTYSTGFKQPSFYSNNNRFKATLNLSPVIYDEETDVQKSYHLAGAICYDVIDNDSYAAAYNTNNPVYHVDIEQKLGRYAIIKSGERWFEYNPHTFLTPKRTKERLEIIEDNYYLRYLESLNGADGLAKEDWVKGSDWQKQRSEILQKKLNVTDMEIPAELAKSKISTNGCLLFYKEDYDVYRSRADQSLF